MYEQRQEEKVHHNEVRKLIRDQYNDVFKGYDFRKEVSIPKLDSREMADLDRRSLDNIYCYRIDLVAFNGEKYILIEIKQELNYEVLTQLWIYKRKFCRHFGVGKKKVSLAVAYIKGDEDIERILKRVNILLLHIHT